MNRRLLTIASMIAMGTCLSGPSDGPKVHREDIEWLDVWLPDANSDDLPRVLLIGDSIARSYGPGVEQALKGRAYVARLATSKSVGDPALLAEISLVLGQSRFDVVHFNNGLHGFGYTEDDYREAFPEFLEAIRSGAKDAKRIWASTTPIRDRDQLSRFDPRTDRVRARNRIAGRIVEAEKIPVDDLFGLLEGHPEYHALDGIHFNERGVAALVEQVTSSIRPALPSKTR
ncbi:SGNH/GDSL hydrolase family protein [Tundrisphaera lichenicola]|uniref:SGNH/GDSL hydrolase family protein n=1 Tax=Tundrisphaera lichenicola TaxID=2029860 RepID=UPI003EBBE0D8